MNGLLDFLQSPGGQGLLGSVAGYAANARRGTPINNIGRGGLAGLLAYGGAQDRINSEADGKVKRGYMQSQIDENTSQSAARAATARQQAAREAYFMGTPGGGLMADAPTSPGAYTTPAVDGVGPVAPMPTTGTAPSGGKFDELSKQFKIPKDALITDYYNNGGKGIADMIFKRGTPNIQINNGVASDLNNTNPGFMPSLTTSTNGQTSMTQIGANGMPFVSAPQGAIDTARAYKNIDSGLKPIKVFNPVTRREEYTSEANVLGVAPAASGAKAGYATEPQMKTTASGPMGADPAGIQREIAQVKNDLMKPMDEPSKAMLRAHLADLQAQGKTTPIPAGNFAAGPSSAETTAAKAAEARAVKTAEADVVRDTDKTKKVNAAGQMIAASDRAIELLKEGPTASGIGARADKVAAEFGMSSKGAQISSKLDIVSGELVNNVPRMEGPQSDGDRIEYKVQAGRVADRTLPTAERIAAAEEVKKIQNKYLHLNGGAANTGGATGDFSGKPQGQSFDAKPPAQQHKGKFATFPDGKRYQSDGMIWKAVP